MCNVFAVHVSHGVNVTSVSLASDAITTRDEPRVMCNITLDEGEKLKEVQWHHKELLIYRWNALEPIEGKIFNYF
jgi:hypothetical protein